MLVFDVGAHDGMKAEALRAKGVRLVCFEPQPRVAAAIRQRFADDPRLKVVQKALGSAMGAARLSICDDADTISTLSDVWKTGRFKTFSWNRAIDVEVATLDWALEQFGTPDYCKIDVEGFELEVLTGLSTALPLLSFDFTKEFEAVAVKCVRRLEAIGFTAFNISYGATQRFKLDRWVDAGELIAELPKVRNALARGDIFAAREKPLEALLKILPASYTDVHEGDSLDALYRAGVAYAGSPLNLHLGCGEATLDGYVNIDYPQEKHNIMRVAPDYEADLTKLVFPDGTVDEIRSHHVFEHLNRVVALGMLILWQEWLRPGGRIVIETPDFEATAAAALRHKGAARMALIRHLEGDQSADWGYHVGQWYPERFERTLAMLGFDHIVTEKSSTELWHDPPLHNVTARAVKRQAVPRSVMIERADALLWESIVAASERVTWEVWRRQLRSFLDGRGAPSGPLAHITLTSGPGCHPRGSG
jgi:FkbM family methyltransferase